MARAKRIYILIVKVNKLFSFFSWRCFLKEIENMFSVFLSSYRNTRESLGVLEEAVESCVFYFLNNSHKFSFSGKRRPEAASSEKEGKGDGELPSSIRSVLCSLREFCAIMWLLHARDKMSKSSRKYRQLRSQSTGSEEVRMFISNRGLRMRDRPI